MYFLAKKHQILKLSLSRSRLLCLGKRNTFQGIPEISPSQEWTTQKLECLMWRSNNLSGEFKVPKSTKCAFGSCVSDHFSCPIRHRY